MPQAMEVALKFQNAGRLDAAENIYRQIITNQPNYIRAYNNLGVILIHKGRLDDGLAEFRRLVTLMPDFAEGHNNLGNCLRLKGQTDEALDAFRKAIELKPDYADAYNNLGVLLRDLGQFDEAIAAFCRAISLGNDFPEAHHNLGITLLLKGELKRGWEEYEWRRRYKHFKSALHKFPQPLWDGSELQGRTLLLYTEQGLGDALQFVRYAPLAAQRGGKIIIGCHPELLRILSIMPGGWPIASLSEPLPAFDLQCPLLNLPAIFSTTLESIPHTVPYLNADAQNIEKWRLRLHEKLRALKAARVGLVWAPRPTRDNDRSRSINLSSLAPIGRVRDIVIVSLQKGTAAAEAKTPPLGWKFFDFSAELNDLADTAALIANLDLVITVDTAVAHLAGAMGKPVWTLLEFVPDWRWLLERQDSPWYPTMRLFRQRARGDWQSVIQDVVGALNLWTMKRTAEVSTQPATSSVESKAQKKFQ